MKQHYTFTAFFTILLSLFTPIAAQQCRDYTCVIAKVERLMKQPQKDYKAILDNLDSAEGYPDSKAEQIRTLRRRVFVLIENEKNEAKRARDEAKKQTEIAQTALAQVEIEKQVAIAEKTKAQAAEDKAKAVLKKIYFYKNSFGLASKKLFGTPVYGFIDKELNTKIEFKYLEAMPFDDIGFAKVSIFSNSEALFIDTLGQEYRLATDIQQLDSNITALDLRDKKFDDIPPSVFQQKQLQILLLNNNSLKTLSVDIEKLSQLKCLNLEFNQLEHLPLSLTKLRKLQYLSLSSNNLTKVPAELYHLTSLQSLELASNKLSELPAELYRLTHLTSLDLGSNLFKTNQLEGVSNLIKLQSLSLYGSNLTSLPADIVGLKELRFLNLHRNQLKSLPANFNQLTHLQELKLGENELSDLMGLCGLKSLKILDLSDNKISTFPEEIKNLVHLSELDLSENPISEFEKTRIKKLLPNCHISFGIDFDLTTWFPQLAEKKDTIAIMTDIVNKIISLQEQYDTDTTSQTVKIELAAQYNELAWYLLQKGRFENAENCIRKGLGFDATNVFLPTNLPTSLLLQGKYREAEKEYRAWKEKPFNQQNLPLYKDVFLEDLNVLEKIGVIPAARLGDVEKIRQILTQH